MTFLMAARCQQTGQFGIALGRTPSEALVG